jgi:predicted DNA-binding transcriptional regulator AlpA
MATNSKILIQFLNEFELSKLLGVKVATVRRWRQCQRGPRYIKVGAAVRYDLNDVRAWLASRPTGGEVLQEVRL